MLPFLSISKRDPSAETLERILSESVTDASAAKAPEIKESSLKPNRLRRTNRPSVNASNLPLPSMSNENEGITLAKNSARALAPSRSSSLIASDASLGSNP